MRVASELSSVNPAAWSPRLPIPASEECSVSSKNKGGREIRKPKQPAKPKPAKEGTELSRIQRQEKPRSSK